MDVVVAVAVVVVVEDYVIEYSLEVVYVVYLMVFVVYAVVFVVWVGLALQALIVDYYLDLVHLVHWLNLVWIDY